MTETEKLENFNGEKISISNEEIEQLKKRDIIIKMLQEDYEKMSNNYQESLKSFEKLYQRLLADKDRQITNQQQQIDKLEQQIDKLTDKIQMLDKKFFSLTIPNIANQNHQKSEN